MSVTSRLLAYSRAKEIVQTEGDLNDALTAIVAGIAPLFFLTVKSWTNGAFLVLFLLALYGAYQRRQDYEALWADRRIVWLTAALASAFVAILVSQLLRLHIQTPAYDGPLRPLAAVLILLHLTARKINFVKIFQWVCPSSVLICALELWLDPAGSEQWHRLATYFVDPLSLGQYMLLLGALSLFMINLVEKDSAAAVALKVSGFLVGIGVSIASESRSAWVAIPALFAIWLITVVRVRDIKLLTGGFVAFAVVCLLALLFVPVVHMRIDEALNSYTSYFDGGNRNTSAGLRLSLLRAAWHLFLMHPLHGYGDGNTPPLASIPAIKSYYTPALEFAIVHNGAHNELFQNMIRSGIFGVISTLLMFFVPLVLFWSAALSKIRQVSAAGVVGLGYIVAVMCFSLSTETFNLKYLITFYALMVAALGAQVIWAGRPSSSAIST